MRSISPRFGKTNGLKRSSRTSDDRLRKGGPGRPPGRLVIGGGNESGFKSKIPRILHPLLGDASCSVGRRGRPGRSVRRNSSSLRTAARAGGGGVGGAAGDESWAGQGPGILDAVSGARREWAADPGADVLCRAGRYPFGFLPPSCGARFPPSPERMRGDDALDGRSGLR
jgi:hypothetical protein